MQLGKTPQRTCALAEKRVAEKADEDVAKGIKEGVEAVKAFGRGVKKVDKKRQK